jgi:hypothetical protein
MKVKALLVLALVALALMFPKLLPTVGVGLLVLGLFLWLLVPTLRLMVGGGTKPPAN